MVLAKEVEEPNIKKHFSGCPLGAAHATVFFLRCFGTRVSPYAALRAFTLGHKPYKTIGVRCKQLVTLH